MKKTTTVIRGLAIDVVVVETTQADMTGILFYYAEIFTRERRTGIRHLVRRTRIPGSGKELAEAVQQRGVRALDTVVKAVTPAFP
ncbi:hypothetical protein [Agrobacterium pusense]|uniref:hypothetical protein n=1 Tax=Agrobacterium pusense TaxID=648995 RepID=UPI000D1BE193|nr:hypothetical protein [Agrobacterium pusense]